MININNATCPRCGRTFTGHGPLCGDCYAETAKESESSTEKLQEPAWLAAKVDQRIAFMLDKSGGEFPEGAVIATPLTEPKDGASKAEMERWERSCDHCGTYVPDGEAFFTGQSVRILRSGHQALIFFGICKNCKEAQ